MHDTSPEIDQKMRGLIQLKLPIERLKMGCSMYETSKKLVSDSILRNNPKISKKDFKIELFLKMYGDDFAPDLREKIINYLSL